MSYDDDWPEDLMEARRTMVRQTIRPVSYEELKTFQQASFQVVTDPWFVRFSEFLETHKAAHFYQAEGPGGARIIYCREGEKGVWFLPGSGMGIIQPKGLQVLKEIVDAL